MWKPWKLRNLFSTSWTSCERKILTAKHFILNDELGGLEGGGWGSWRGALRKHFTRNSLIRKVNNRAPLFAFLSSNNTTCHYYTAGWLLENSLLMCITNVLIFNQGEFDLIIVMIYAKNPTCKLINCLFYPLPRNWERVFLFKTLPA